MTARRANRRIRLLLLLLVGVFAATLLRAAWLQGVRAASLARLGARQHSDTITIPARRGTIYDRNGVQLAIGEQATTVFADPKQIRDPVAAARAVGSKLRLDPNRLYGLLADRTRGFVYVQRKADPARAEALARLKIPGLGFYPEERRIYPQGSLAPQVLGYAGTENRGLAGLELGLDPKLEGRSGREKVIKDPFGRPIDIVSSVDERKGADVYLTLDHVLQASVERILRGTIDQWHAKSATAIVLDPHTGGVLAMGVAPGFNANAFPQVPFDLQRNRAVTDTYEPGSTFKVVTASAVLSEHVVTPQTSFVLPYSIHVADRVIHDSESRGTEQMSVAQIFARSSNVGTVTLAELLGATRLSRWISRFGFGHKTGIDYPGESRGIVLPLDRWSGSTIGTVPIGQGIAVTPIQMAAAYAAVANGGFFVRPHLVERIGRRRPPRARRRILSRAVARQLTTLMQDVVAQGTGVEAAVPGYRVAGKTGTAQKPGANGTYSKGAYVSSFVGFVPASAPRMVILVMVDEPRGGYFGGKVAAPAFQRIAKFALQYFDVPPDGTR